MFALQNPTKYHNCDMFEPESSNIDKTGNLSKYRLGIVSLCNNDEKESDSQQQKSYEIQMRNKKKSRRFIRVDGFNHTVVNIRFGVCVASNKTSLGFDENEIRRKQNSTKSK